MATVIKRKPTSPGRRFVVNVVDKDLHKGKPFEALTESKNRISGRNNRGKITVRHRGGGKKPWRQKGTGRARAGTSRGPIWRSGGVTFASQPRSYAQKVNKKMYKGSISVILSELLRTDRLKIVSEFDITEPKTKNITTIMNSLNIKDALLMTDELDENLYLSSRNLYHVGVCDTQSIDPVSLIGYDNVVMTKAALKKVEAML